MGYPGCRHPTDARLVSDRAPSVTHCVKSHISVADNYRSTKFIK